MDINPIEHYMISYGLMIKKLI